jgi:transcriptional regulator with XRE-family HTH domain
MPPRTISTEQAFGEVIRELRLERSLSQEDLALAADRHRTYISLLERGRNSPSLRTIFLLADVLGIKPAEILERVDKLREGRRRSD